MSAAVQRAVRLRVAAALAGEPLDDPTWDALVRRAATVPDDALELPTPHDAAAAARLDGYLATALAHALEHPDEAPDARSLVSAEELHLQVHGMAGSDRPLPDVRFHRLVEERVRRHPDAVAAVQGDVELTYAELNARANAVARGLLGLGLEREDVVAVVTARDLDWMTAVLAVLKAGGTYLPIEPQFPAERIATTLRRSGSTIVLTAPGATDHLDVALGTLDEPPVRALVRDLATGPDEGDLDVEVDADQRAYIYFTSGSTGEPKGAMCEQAGMLNHLLAKIEDLEIGEGDAVAQTAPQCFDISLWQLVAALLVGGRTVVVPQDVVLDVERHVALLERQHVAVLQVVPSYLEAVMTYLERHPAALPDLRVVSVTGEAVKAELVERWFAVMPQVALVNAYGLTETSDDTNHEVMRQAPEGSRVPLGPPVRNVRVYVVDPDLVPVPLGAPGEIVFSGVCVGRGYVNDPERTAQAFVADPHVPGERLYRSGDFGRWRPDGKLEFLGRRDTQLKIAGFRIEIGEIENTLLRLPAVRDASVVFPTGQDGATYLVGFYDAPHELPVDDVRAHLAASLPHYMVPVTLHWRDGLPLSANGKVDRKALTAEAVELEREQASARVVDPPRTVAERQVAQVWARVLGVDASELGRDDHFFDRGGSSLSAVKVVIGLDRAVTLKDVTTHPVLSDLAGVLDGSRATRDGLLQPLGAAPRTASTALVCLPHAGGNAVNFEPVARALAGTAVAVHAVELPGHDLAGEPGAFASVDDVAAVVAEEVRGLEVPDVVLWGHSAGAALALAVAERLEALGAPVSRVLLGSQLAGTAASRRAVALEVVSRTDDQVVETMTATGGLPPGESLGPDRVAHLAAAYRHDVEASCVWLAGRLDDPAAPTVSAPVTVVVAADDPSVADADERHAEWRALADHVDLVVLPDGGHHLPRTRPSAVADLVTAPVPVGAR